MASWLPEGWKIKTKKAKNGSKTELYVNEATHQEFYTKADMLRYANYLKYKAPILHDVKDFRKDDLQFSDDDKSWDDNELMRDYNKTLKKTAEQSGEVCDAVEAGKKFRKLEDRPPKRRR